MQTIGKSKKEAPLIPGVRPRPFPYPFQAGLAIASDIDRCDRDTFIRVHQYLNCPQKGLGLPVSDAFFGVGRRYRHMAYFMDDGRTPSDDAELIRLGLASGLIDTLHSWGAFDFEPPQPVFLRQTAENLVAALSARNLRVPLWSNHGAPINYQNVYARTEPRFGGDDPGSPYYTGDLLKGLGIDFFWGSELLPWPTSCHGRGAAALRRRGRVLQHVFKNIFKQFMGRGAAVRRLEAIAHLACPTMLRDGQVLLEYSRFNRHPKGLWGQPTRHTLRHGLHPKVLKALVREQGYLIVYTHLGMPAPPGKTLFSQPDACALERLAAYYRNGRIWVAPTAVLLKFWRVMHHMRWHAAWEGEKIVIRITAIDDPAGGLTAPRAKDLAGVCFYTPRPEVTLICLEDQPLATAIWPADASGRQSVGLEPAAAPGIGFLEEFAKR